MNHIQGSIDEFTPLALRILALAPSINASPFQEWYKTYTIPIGRLHNALSEGYHFLRIEFLKLVAVVTHVWAMKTADCLSITSELDCAYLFHLYGVGDWQMKRRGVVIFPDRSCSGAEWEEIMTFYAQHCLPVIY